MKKGRIFAVPFREGALAPVPGRLDKFIERTGKQGKSKYQGKERANVDSSRGIRPPGPIEMKRGRGRTKQSNKWIYHISYDEEFDPGSG